jgi:bifunctional DNA-binding transcriptional regulator/antitoxin component of YhaV-PrlF toxin-antitoxin module
MSQIGSTLQAKAHTVPVRNVDPFPETPEVESVGLSAGLLAPPGAQPKFTVTVPMKASVMDALKPRTRTIKESDGPFSAIAETFKHLFGGDDETSQNTDVTASPSPSQSKHTGPIRNGINELVPGAEKLPDWVLPIVARAEQNAAPGTVVEAYVDNKGRAVISGQVAAQQSNDLSSLHLIDYQAPILINIRAVIEDPTEATPEAPAAVKVTVTNPVTEESVTGKGQITTPEEAADVTQQVTIDVVESAKAAEVLPPDAPTPDAPAQIDPRSVPDDSTQEPEETEQPAPEETPESVPSPADEPTEEPDQALS